MHKPPYIYVVEGRGYMSQGLGVWQVVTYQWLGVTLTEHWSLPLIIERLCQIQVVRCLDKLKSPPRSICPDKIIISQTTIDPQLDKDWYNGSVVVTLTVFRWCYWVQTHDVTFFFQWPPLIFVSRHFFLKFPTLVPYVHLVLELSNPGHTSTLLLMDCNILDLDNVPSFIEKKWIKAGKQYPASRCVSHPFFHLFCHCLGYNTPSYSLQRMYQWQKTVRLHSEFWECNFTTGAWENEKVKLSGGQVWVQTCKVNYVWVLYFYLESHAAYEIHQIMLVRQKIKIKEVQHKSSL